MQQQYTIRHATHQDQPGIIALIDSVFQEYSTSIDTEGSESDLNDIRHHYVDQSGQFWVLVDPADPSNRVHGCHAALPLTESHDPSISDQKVCTFKRLYLAANLRGGGWGQQLMQTTIEWARTHGFHRVEFWSDTRFTRAHHFFASLDFETNNEIRTMHDSHEPYQEIFFWKDL